MDYQVWGEKVKKQFKKMRTHAAPYETEVLGKQILVLPEVFSPKYFTDSAYFAEVIPKIVGKGSLLEIGTGTGVVALFAILGGAKVTATDINPAAIENSIKNADRFGLTLDVRLGDLFSPIKKEKFDYIFWNHPFNRSEQPVDDVLLRAGFDEGYEALKRFYKEAPHFLNPGGAVLLGTSAYARLEEIERYAKDYNYLIQTSITKESLMAEDESDQTTHRVYKLMPKVAG